MSVTEGATGADPAEVAAEYFRAWQGKDFDALRALLADDVTFVGPLGTAEDADGALRGLCGMAEILTDIEVHRRWADGQDVITWFDLHTSLAPPAATVNWSRVVDGRITAIRVTFDARELAAALGR